MSSHSPNRHAVTFIFITVFLDMVGFGLVMPVLPRLIEEVSGAGIASAQNLALLAGTVMFAQIFGYFLQDGSPIQSPNVGYFIAAALCMLALVIFARLPRRN